MQKSQKVWMIVGIVLVLSLIGTSAASVRTEGYQEKLTYSPVRFGALDAPQMVLGTSMAALISEDVEESCYTPSNCFKATGRYFITYLRKSEGHWVTWCQLYVPDYIDNYQEAKKWRWSPEYIADLCSLPDEPQTWEGDYIRIQKEMVPVECAPVCPVYEKREIS